jgi:hypothetical protein
VCFGFCVSYVFVHVLAITCIYIRVVEYGFSLVILEVAKPLAWACMYLGMPLAWACMCSGVDMYVFGYVLGLAYTHV